MTQKESKIIAMEWVKNLIEKNFTSGLDFGENDIDTTKIYAQIDVFDAVLEERILKLKGN